MSNIFKYKMALDAESTSSERHKLFSVYGLRYIALVIVGTIMTTVFSAIVMILDYCFPGSLDGTYPKLFF